MRSPVEACAPHRKQRFNGPRLSLGGSGRCSPSAVFAKMPLLPLEFVDCLSDSPYFRGNLQAHEKELEITSSQIKVLIKQVNHLVEKAKGMYTHTRALVACVKFLHPSHLTIYFVTFYTLLHLYFC